jgi:nucleoside phosphorylase
MTQSLSSTQTGPLLLIIAQHEWDGGALGDPAADIYKLLAEDRPRRVALAGIEPDCAMRFTLKHVKLDTVAARVPTGLVETALISRSLLEQLQPSIAAQVGFGGILSDDVKLGDVAIASQVDCYLTKNAVRKAESDRTEILFAGDVFRPSHEFIQSAVNLKQAHARSYKAFQAEARASAARTELLNNCTPELRSHVRSADERSENADVAHVHAVHFACAEVVSTSDEAVKWLKRRDRKLGIIDMESGGFLAAAWDFSHRHDRLLRTLVVRGAGGYGDHRHDRLIRREAHLIRRFAFETACIFVTRLLSERRPQAIGSETQPSAQVNGQSRPLAVDVALLLPLEEEFSYFADLLRTYSGGLLLTTEYRVGRYYYLFTVGEVKCAATFLGDMGLVRMGLAADDTYRAFKPKLLVVLGIAAGFSGPDGDMKICDVGLARRVYLYMHRARNRMDADRRDGVGTEFSTEPPITASRELVRFITADARFTARLDDWREACAQELEDKLGTQVRSGSFDPIEYNVSMRPNVRGIDLASGDLLSGGREFTRALARRGCSAADMEAGGAAIAYRRLSESKAVGLLPKLLVIRGISDRGDENKHAAEKAGEQNMFRRLCMRNATRLLLMALEDANFRAILEAD